MLWSDAVHVTAWSQPLHVSGGEREGSFALFPASPSLHTARSAFYRCRLVCLCLTLLPRLIGEGRNGSRLLNGDAGRHGQRLHGRNGWATRGVANNGLDNIRSKMAAVWRQWRSSIVVSARGRRGSVRNAAKPPAKLRAAPCAGNARGLRLAVVYGLVPSRVRNFFYCFACRLVPLSHLHTCRTPLSHFFFFFFFFCTPHARAAHLTCTRTLHARRRKSAHGGRRKSISAMAAWMRR